VKTAFEVVLAVKPGVVFGMAAPSFGEVSVQAKPIAFVNTPQTPARR